MNVVVQTVHPTTARLSIIEGDDHWLDIEVSLAPKSLIIQGLLFRKVSGSLSKTYLRRSIKFYPYKKGFSLPLDEVNQTLQTLIGDVAAIVGEKLTKSKISGVAMPKLDFVEMFNKVPKKGSKGSLYVTKSAESNLRVGSKHYHHLTTLLSENPKIPPHPDLYDIHDEDLPERFKLIIEKSYKPAIGTKEYDSYESMAAEFMVTLDAMKTLHLSQASWIKVDFNKAVTALPDDKRVGVKVAGRWWPALNNAAVFHCLPVEVLQKLLEERPNISSRALDMVYRQNKSKGKY